MKKRGSLAYTYVDLESPYKVLAVRDVLLLSVPHRPMADATKRRDMVPEFVAVAVAVVNTVTSKPRYVDPRTKENYCLTTRLSLFGIEQTSPNLLGHV
jgi:hypothetical protein